MVLLETKSTASKSAKFLEELIDKTIEYESERVDIERTSYSDVQQKKNLWNLEKLVKEFRKLFTDKTVFMNIYANTQMLSGKVTSEMSMPTQCTFRPTVNKKSKELDVIITFLMRQN